MVHGGSARTHERHDAASRTVQSLQHAVTVDASLHEAGGPTLARRTLCAAERVRGRGSYGVCAWCDAPERQMGCGAAPSDIAQAIPRQPAAAIVRGSGKGWPVPRRSPGRRGAEPSSASGRNKSVAYEGGAIGLRSILWSHPREGALAVGLRGGKDARLRLITAFVRNGLVST